MRLTLVITFLIIGALLTYAKLVAIAQSPPAVPQSVRFNAASADVQAQSTPWKP